MAKAAKKKQEPAEPACGPSQPDFVLNHLSGHLEGEVTELPFLLDRLIKDPAVAAFLPDLLKTFLLIRRGTIRQVVGEITGANRDAIQHDNARALAESLGVPYLELQIADQTEGILESDLLAWHGYNTRYAPVDGRP